MKTLNVLCHVSVSPRAGGETGVGTIRPGSSLSRGGSLWVGVMPRAERHVSGAVMRQALGACDGRRCLQWVAVETVDAVIGQRLVRLL